MLIVGFVLVDAYGVCYFRVFVLVVVGWAFYFADLVLCWLVFDLGLYGWYCFVVFFDWACLYCVSLVLLYNMVWMGCDGLLV